MVCVDKSLTDMHVEPTWRSDMNLHGVYPIRRNIFARLWKRRSSWLFRAPLPTAALTAQRNDFGPIARSQAFRLVRLRATRFPKVAVAFAMDHAQLSSRAGMHLVTAFGKSFGHDGIGAQL